MIGAGTMGSGIAQIAAQAGCHVVLVDASETALTRSEENLNKIFDRLVSKGRVGTSEAEDIASRIHRTTSLEALSSSDLVIEAIVEDLGIKSTLFQHIEDIVSEEAVLATNVFAVGHRSGQGCRHPERVIGLHFFNPAPLMALVEVVSALQTKAGLAELAMSEMTAWGKSPAMASDTPGFIVNRVARPFYSEALRIHEEGIASVEDIDASNEGKRVQNGAFRIDGSHRS